MTAPEIDDGEDTVRIDGQIVIETTTAIDRDTYEAWQDGDPEATDRVVAALDATAADEMGQSLTARDIALNEAWLIDVGQGHPIVRLKKWET